SVDAGSLKSADRKVPVRIAGRARRVRLRGGGARVALSGAGTSCLRVAAVRRHGASVCRSVQGSGRSGVALRRVAQVRYSHLAGVSNGESVLVRLTKLELHGFKS